MDEATVRSRLTAVLAGNSPMDPAERIDRAMSDFEPSQVVQWPGGWAWLVPQKEREGAVRAMSLDPAQASHAVEAVREAARGRWDSVVVSSYLGDESGTSFVRAAAPTLVATRMSVDVRTVPDTDAIELRPMSAERFDRYLREGLESYAESLFGSGGFATMDEARARSKEQHDELLPDGLATKDNHLWSAYAPGGDDELGILWIADHEGWSFIYEIAVDPAHQGRGHGTAMLRAGAAAVRKSGRDLLWLNVFGHNPDARRLYEREGYALNEQIWRLDTAPSPR